MTAADCVQELLFLQEFTDSARLRQDAGATRIAFFLQRIGGLHLLLLLLNAHYRKPPAGRPGGWPFGVLQERISVSERHLRGLLADAIEVGLVLRRHGDRDRRCVVYCLDEAVVSAWEKLVRQMRSSVEDAVSHLGAGALADIDYRTWRPDRAAIEQVPTPAVYLHLKSGLSADPRLARIRKRSARMRN